MATKKQAQALRRALKDQGRSVAWLAEAMGYSRSYVSNVLNGNLPFTEKFQRQAAAALAAPTTVPVTYQGRVIHVPEDIYRRGNTLPLLTVESAYEEAWKRAWVQEHGQSALAVAADRAFRAASALGGAA